MTGVASSIPRAQRKTLAALGDLVIPAAEGMPSASEAGVEGKWLDKVLAARPDLLPELERVLMKAEGKEPAAELAGLRAGDPAGFETLALVVVGAYYLNPRVRKLIGYPGQKERPAYPDEAEYYLEGGLLDPVVERGPFYRPTP